MKKYYINNGEQNLGSFDLNDLKSKGIDRDTLVWFFGLERWSRARSIPELKELFRTSLKRREGGFRESVDDETASFFKDRLLLFVAAGLILGFGILFYSFYITSTITQDEQRSHNELQESKELFMQERVVSVQALPEKLPLLLAEKKASTKRIAQIEIELAIADQNLAAAEQELMGARYFQFLRMSDVRQQEIEAAKKKIEVWKDEIKLLKAEMHGLDTASAED
ncbi:DUF4339 domain-containing protein [Flavobacterium sp. WW92]|uniref:DUF4339 domain-containing protein n=1 Tax=unclassified Flavobacterium TaxID=196869 RepID=UPI002224E422|nr:MULTISPECIES: DUF4339 domain-containing protein [unclassified Flavobacterium]WDO12633.1 DUF4339 domain-containing protein [Flavobacterium sp. WW92]